MILRQHDSITIAIETGKQPIRSTLVRLLFEFYRNAFSKKLANLKSRVRPPCILPIIISATCIKPCE